MEKTQDGWFFEYSKKREFETLSCSSCGEILGYARISDKTIPDPPIYHKLKIGCLCKDCFKREMAQRQKEKQKASSPKKKKMKIDIRISDIK